MSLLTAQVPPALCPIVSLEFLYKCFDDEGTSHKDWKVIRDETEATDWQVTLQLSSVSINAGKNYNRFFCFQIFH